MTEIPKNELRALGITAHGNLNSLRVLELGNKKNQSGLYRDFYEAVGASYICTDINGKDGAIAWDIRDPITEEIMQVLPVDIVTNFGFTEHVQDRQEECWANIHAMVHPSYGRLSCVTPAPGGWENHGKAKGFPGRWYPHPLFYQELAYLNGYVIDDLWYDPREKLVGCRMHRIPPGAYTEGFQFPRVGMFDNINENFTGLLWQSENDLK